MHPSMRGSWDTRVADSCISSTGALVNFSGLGTGRSPKNKRVVLDDNTKDEIWWGDVNMPITPEGFAMNKARVFHWLHTTPANFIIDGFASWDPDCRFKVRVVCNRPYHALFMKQMLIRPTAEEIATEFKDGPDFHIYNGGEFLADSNIDTVEQECCPAVNLSGHEMAILGTHYAGEMKKGLFGVMHYYMPKRGVLSMHASANEGKDGDISLLFGLSGTGKTTLSADPKRVLLGDDEHCWTDDGIFNIEGGCYAKCIDLTEENEPEIYRAIRFGAILENISFSDHDPREVDYFKTCLTENTRAAYPLENMPNVKLPAIGGHPKNIIFLVCDAFGVCPPVAKLTREQAMYHFISGYTAKVAGTEVGITDPVASFSACYGEAFLPLHPNTYADMLADKVEKHDSNVWLVNTGWTGGKYGVGHRFSLKHTRAIIDAIHDGHLDNCEYRDYDVFNLKVPTKIPGVPNDALWPEKAWKSRAEFDDQVKHLAGLFIDNFKTYEDETPQDVVKKGGPIIPV